MLIYSGRSNRGVGCFSPKWAHLRGLLLAKRTVKLKRAGQSSHFAAVFLCLVVFRILSPMKMFEITSGEEESSSATDSDIAWEAIDISN
ncbi:hypothetical protein RchiOBHm_Chr5g0001651 [Rosa chinensis]|uniref:Uncharacterized protein n=1 Tax=Rosa chinensis TaxID=74649 RepID=A0A2P6Q2A6_ROSCH|nr:hypothetical protein RchiOBHm_Chr5g0001651 [Rosa chinensis]